VDRHVGAIHLDHFTKVIRDETFGPVVGVMKVRDS
jgi:acyl-CoA reductase-like NAD-dependent aldehyde dehydrogenase